MVANQHISTYGQYDLFVAPQVSEEWTSPTNVWLMQIDKDTDRNNTSFNENFQQRVTSVEVFEQ